jgi:pimeloyl-ACP methyl ester carboxylesterase
MITTDTAVRALGDGFVSEVADLDGRRAHYVRGGRGPALVLLHGFPEDWLEWRRVLPRLAERFTVLAVDLPGVGGSDPGGRGHSAPDLARDVQALLGALGVGPVHLAGHDVGGAVAYSLAREFPDQVRTVAVLETPVPGIAPHLAGEIDAPLWHVPFHMTPDLPEALVTGREEAYFRYFLTRFTHAEGVFGDDEVAHYAAAYARPGGLSSAFGFYRALPDTAADNLARTGPIDVPLLLVGGEHLFGPIVGRLADVLRADHGWADVRAEVLPGAMHYVVEECPDAVAALIEGHAA